MRTLLSRKAFSAGRKIPSLSLSMTLMILRFLAGPPLPSFGDGRRRDEPVLNLCPPVEDFAYDVYKRYFSLAANTILILEPSLDVLIFSMQVILNPQLIVGAF